MAIRLRTTREPEVVIKQLADQLALSMWEVGSLLRPSSEVPIAAWGYDRAAEKERIWINRSLLMLMPDEELMMLVKHEVLHRAAYAEGYEFPDDELGNVALDVVINRILHMAHPELMVRVSRKVYPEESRNSPLALARADLQRGEVPEKYRDIWDEVWNSDHVPSVYPIYFAIATDEHAVKEQNQKCWGGAPSKAGSGGTPPPPEPDKKEEKEEKEADEPAENEPEDGQMSMFDFSPQGEIEVKEKLTRPPDEEKKEPQESPRMIRALPPVPLDDQVLDRATETATEVMEAAVAQGFSGTGFSASFSRLFQRLELIPQKTRAEQVEDFLAQIRAKDEADAAVSRLMAAIGVEPQVSVVPMNLTATGVFMAGVGVSDVTGLWWNETPYDQRPKCRIYVDTSPSMSHWARRTVYMIDCIKDSIPAEMYAFAGSVVPCQTEEFARGEYYQGSSTCFNAVIEDILQSEEKIAVIFTDGESSVNWRNTQAVKESEKQIYSIICGYGPNDYWGKTLNQVSVDVMHLTERPEERDAA